MNYTDVQWRNTVLCDASLNLTAITVNVLQHACNMPRRLQPASNSKERFFSPLLPSYHCEVTSARLGILETHT